MSFLENQISMLKNAIENGIIRKDCSLIPEQKSSSSIWCITWASLVGQMFPSPKSVHLLIKLLQTNWILISLCPYHNGIEFQRWRACSSVKLHNLHWKQYKNYCRQIFWDIVLRIFAALLLFVCSYALQERMLPFSQSSPACLFLSRHLLVDKGVAGEEIVLHSTKAMVQTLMVSSAVRR